MTHCGLRACLKGRAGLFRPHHNGHADRDERAVVRCSARSPRLDETKRGRAKADRLRGEEAGATFDANLERIAGDAIRANEGREPSAETQAGLPRCIADRRYAAAEEALVAGEREIQLAERRSDSAGQE